MTEQDKQIRKELDDIKNHRKSFAIHTATDDMTGIILKGHLFIENELDRLIDNTLINPLNITQATFSNKIELAYSLGVVDKEWLGGFKKLNSIRNKYAHNIDYSFTEKDFEDLISTLSKEAKEEFIKDIQGEEFIKEISRVLKNKTDIEPIDLNQKTRVLLANFWIYLKLQNIQIFEILKLQYLEREIERRKLDGNK